MIKEQDAQSYWKERAEKYKDAAVGFDSNKNMDKQNLEYLIRKSFIFNHINPKIGVILDYGCGIGRYSNDFCNYIGVDMTHLLLEYARENNPSGIFLLLEKPYITTKIAKQIRELVQPIDTIFTATVLQHCDDELVLKIFSSFYEHIGRKNMTFILYEKDNHDRKPHVVSRHSTQYVQLLTDGGYNIKAVNHYTHMVHREIHSLHIIKT